MISLEALKISKQRMTTIVNTMQTRSDKLSAAVSAAKGDQTRSQAFIREVVQGLEKDAKPWFQQQLDEINSLSKLVLDQSEPWESKPLLLSRQHFSANPGEDAAIRMRYATELSLMDKHLFRLTAEVAIHEQNLPVIYQCYLQSLAKTDHLDLSNVEIPAQSAALDVIHACTSLPAQAELIAAQAGAVAMTAMRKIELGRQMARPNDKNVKPAITERTNHVQPNAA